MKTEVKIIIISWELIEYNLDTIKSLTRPIDYGIYQIYGRHNSYGKDVLLYIGKAESRNFATRLQDGGREVYDFKECTIEAKYIRLGYISMTDDPSDIEKYQLVEYEKEWEKNISIAERILIATHPPALNKQLAHRLADMKFEDDYIIINWGDYGDLLPEVSTLRNSYKFYDFDKVYLGGKAK